jgi:hypothetical protein
MANGTVRLLRRSVGPLDVARRPHGLADPAPVGVERTTRRDEPVMIVSAAVDARPRPTPGGPLGLVRPVLPPHTREVTGSIPVLPMAESPLVERVFAFWGGSSRLGRGASTCRESSPRGCARTGARTGAARRQQGQTALGFLRAGPAQDQPTAGISAAVPRLPHGARTGPAPRIAPRGRSPPAGPSHRAGDSGSSTGSPDTSPETTRPGAPSPGRSLQEVYRMTRCYPLRRTVARFAGPASTRVSSDTRSPTA